MKKGKGGLTSLSLFSWEKAIDNKFKTKYP